MWVLTVDQIDSRRLGDRVPELLAALDADRSLTLLRPFQRTAGDEVQAVTDRPEIAIEVVQRVLSSGGWSIGVGAGPVDEPLPADARAGSGAAFVLAREAVEAAKSRRRQSAPPLAVRGVRSELAAEAEAVLVLLAAVDARRSPEGRALVDHLRRVGSEGRQSDLAERFGITQQAVSARLRAALWAEEVAALPAATRLLALSGT